jgi:hypothetical protein
MGPIDPGEWEGANGGQDERDVLRKIGKILLFCGLQGSRTRFSHHGWTRGQFSPSLNSHQKVIIRNLAEGFQRN